MIKTQGNPLLLRVCNDNADKTRTDFPGWLTQFRRNTFQQAQQKGIPTPKDEAWKYTDLRGLAEHEFHLPRTGAKINESLLPAWAREDVCRIVFCDGLWSKELTRIPESSGVTICPLSEAWNRTSSALIESLIGRLAQEKSLNYFEALHWSLFQEGVFIHMGSRARLETPIHVLHIMTSEEKDALITPQAIVVAEPLSEAVIVESFRGESAAMTFTNAMTLLELKEGAVIHYTRIQDEGPATVHVGGTRVWQEKNSVLEGLSVSLGASLSRHNLDIIQNDEGIHSTLNGLVLTQKKQHSDHHTCVQHRFPHGTSTQLYKMILRDQSRTVFNGRIVVSPIAQQTNSYQLNKNLILGDQCQVDTKPQLEIFADDVKCTHGATIGRLNEDELFYLQTRGIARSQAQALLTRGFACDLLEKQHPTIQKKIQALLAPVFQSLESS